MSLSAWQGMSASGSPRHRLSAWVSSSQACDQTLSWSDTGQLTGIKASGNQVASYVYTPEGTLLSQTDGSSTTIYLPGEQITDNGGAISGIRYYPLPGGLTAVRTGSGASYGFEIASDQHGTSTLLLDNTAQTPAWRQYDPFGNSRGAAATWIDNRTFLGDPTDTVTALTDVGARSDPTGLYVPCDSGTTRAAGVTWPVASSTPVTTSTNPCSGTRRPHRSPASCPSGYHSGTPAPPAKARAASTSTSASSSRARAEKTSPTRA